ncbi:hypothetical protein LZ575_14190 [Antarcticibacterium sp. 1MA-6-2]|uniref:hypothetical protein n=1 Tax=Antarcticibacterium sp. 1MA-6-2 TaxID=2908210 RepID=UPI001F18C494|nr:hypothetical protein [Antarcticibacterium sp. 1MA-6-2]UJH90063.1 hypothetical protein LZ575_14190 [Antarcticibacterium sp. 1MA-6-2]
MKLKLRHIIPVVVLLFTMSYNTFGQARPCPPGEVPCGANHTCLPRGSCGGPNPPPPGLVVPIDSNLSFLLIAGLGLGVWFFASSGKKFFQEN